MLNLYPRNRYVRILIYMILYEEDICGIMKRTEWSCVVRMEADRWPQFLELLLRYIHLLQEQNIPQ
jgi:hypothetical protein